MDRPCPRVPDALRVLLAEIVIHASPSNLKETRYSPGVALRATGPDFLLSGGRSAVEAPNPEQNASGQRFDAARPSSAVHNGVGRG
jgi:hypothetical protein